MKELPEEFHLWPDDPFDLLNLKRSDDARTAKRAYFKLIRKYKPDRFPAEFQKIREAYESVESWLQWHREDDEPDEQSDNEPVDSHPNVEVAQLADESPPTRPVKKESSRDRDAPGYVSSTDSEVSSTDSEFEPAEETAPRTQLASPMDLSLIHI